MGIKTYYLALYNAACVAGWCYVLWLVFEHYVLKKNAPDALYAVVEQPLKIVQTAAVLEIVHVALGLVRSSVFTTFLQVFSRVGVLWGITNLSPPSAAHWCTTLMVLSWGAVEVPRYSYYLVNLFTAKPPAFLTWLRYHLFIVLYPSGITGEVLTLWNALPFVAAHGVWRVALPNEHNIVFDYHLVLWGMLLMYVPGSYTMYSHMWKQMRKYSGSGGGDDKAASASSGGSRKPKTQ